MKALLALLLLGCASTVSGAAADAPEEPERRDAGDNRAPDVVRPTSDLPDLPQTRDVFDVPSPRDVRDVSFADVWDVPTVDDDVPGPAAVARIRPRASCADPTERTCGVAWVRGGRFDLGPGERNWEQPAQRGTRVSAFEIDRFEFTVARFRRSLVEIARRYPNHPFPGTTLPDVDYPGGQRWRFAYRSASEMFLYRELISRGAQPNNPDRFNLDLVSRATWSRTPEDREDHPMVGVWYELAQLACLVDGGRLPTEAEWEWIARWLPDGRPTPRRYAWGDEAPDCHRTHRAGCPGGDVPVAVGSFAPTGLFYDLTGNVAELTADKFATYTYAQCWGDRMRVDPLCRFPDFTQSLVTRGGSYRIGTPLENVARTDDLGGFFASPYIGFRCAYTPQSP